MSLLEVRDLTRWHAGAPAPVLRHVDLDVHAGEALCVLGSSGAGKSTLVRLLAGLEQPQGGTVTAPPDSPRPALVPQSPDLFPWLSVRENIAIGGRYAVNRERFRPERVDELLADLGIAELAAARPAQLSGGQAQRVALGRALAVGSPVVLMDEPFSALDPAIRTDLQSWLRRRLDQHRFSAVLVTHDVDEALAIGDRVVYLDGRRGITAEWRPAADGASRESVLAHYRAGDRTAAGEHGHAGEHGRAGDRAEVPG